MLLIQHLGPIQAAYNCAKKVCPELETTTVYVEITDKVKKVTVLEGDEEDEGKYKILINVSTDKGINAHNFTVGIAQVAFRLRYGEFVIDALRGPGGATAANDYNQLIDAITEELNNTPYISNVIYE